MSVVVRRAECRHRQVDGGVALACIGVLGAVAQTAGDAQRIGLAHRHRTGIIVHRTAVGVGHGHIVLTSSQILSRVGRLRIIPSIGIRSGAVGNRHRSRTITTTMAGDRCAGEPGDLRQRGHRHRDDDGRVVVAAVDHMHTHLGGSGNHGTSRPVLADDEVACSDAVVAGHRTHGCRQIRNREFALCLVDGSCDFAAEARHIHIRLRVVLYIICISPCFLGVVAGSIFIGINDLALAGELRRLQLLADEHRIDGAAATVLHVLREAGIQHHRGGRQIKLQRSSSGDALNRSLSTYRKGPIADIDRDCSKSLGGTSYGVVTRVIKRIGQSCLADIVIKIHRKHTGITSRMRVGSHHLVGSIIIIHTSCPCGCECGKVVGETSGDRESRSIGTLGIGFRHGDHDTRIDIYINMYGHLAAGTDTDTIFRCNGVSNSRGS